MPGQRKEIRVPGMAEPISHFTHVVTAGGTFSDVCKVTVVEVSDFVRPGILVEIEATAVLPGA